MGKAPGLLGVMLCAVLLACASTGEAPPEDVEAPATVVHSWEEARADERCVTVQCDEASCAFVRCCASPSAGREGAARGHLAPRPRADGALQVGGPVCPL